jgi:hypothetical protein
MSDRQVSAVAGGHQTIMGSSFGLCPRPDTSQDCSPFGRLAIAVELPIQALDS